MARRDDRTPITIPILLDLARRNGNAIKGELGGDTVNVTLKQDPGAVTEDSYRWLDRARIRPAFRRRDPRHVDTQPASAIRARCPTPSTTAPRTDGGGVHSNSGVPNHGYALLVDGGTYNGQTVTATRPRQGSAHLLAGAEPSTRSPTTKFADHADALEESCTRPDRQYRSKA